jgi:hypothetical protein
MFFVGILNVSDIKSRIRSWIQIQKNVTDPENFSTHMDCLVIGTILLYGDRLLKV